MPFVGGLISDASAYQYLPKSVEYLPEPVVMLQMLADAGFTEVDRTLRRRADGGATVAIRLKGRPWRPMRALASSPKGPLPPPQRKNQKPRKPRPWTHPAQAPEQ